MMSSYKQNKNLQVWRKKSGYQTFFILFILHICLMLAAEDYNSRNWNYTSKSATKLSPHQINNTAGVALSLAVFVYQVWICVQLCLEACHIQNNLLKKI